MRLKQLRELGGRLRRLSLRSSLALLLLPTLALITGVELWLTRQDALAAANAAYDRALLGALKSIDANISTASGGLSVELPYRMFEFFELTASGPVYFRVATADGLVELGSPDLPAPPAAPTPRVPVFYDARYFGETLRVAAYLRALDPPLGREGTQQVLIQVAESTQSRREFSRAFVARAAVRDGLLFVLTLLCAALAVGVALRPLQQLARQVRGRGPDDLTPLAADALPADLQPLAQAANQQMQRTQALMTQQRQFLDDASHQLRTHLTTLQMQVDYALRAQQEQQQQEHPVRQALDALSTELARATRSTNQLLTLARSDTATLQAAEFDVAALLREVAVELLPRARARHIDLGIQPPAGPATAVGDRGLLREALHNLAANAIAYTREEGVVTVSAAADALGWSLNVEDDGPGLSDSERATLGQRFLRGGKGGPGATHPGSGLGLAIARSVAEKHGGALRLEARAQGSGLHAVLWWPKTT